MTNLELSGEVEAPVRKTRRKRVEKSPEEIEARAEARGEAPQSDRVRIILDNGDQIPKNGLMIGHNGTNVSPEARHPGQCAACAPERAQRRRAGLPGSGPRQPSGC